MMDAATNLMPRFFQKTQDDERLLTTRHPQIFILMQQGGMPAAVLQNYNLARNECQERLGFTAQLMRSYVDPNTPTPDEIPEFAAVKTVPGGGLAGSVADLMAMPPTMIVSPSDIVTVGRRGGVVLEHGGEVLAPGQPSGALGVVPVAVWYIGGLIVTAAISYYAATKMTGNEVKFAEQKVELAKQTNFAKVWDTAAGLVAQCIGVNPTPDRITKCWEDISKRFPAIIAAIPDHKMSSGGAGWGFFGTVGLIVAIGVTVVGGFWVYGKVQDARARREEKAAQEEDRAARREDREARRTTAPGMAGARRRRRRA